LERRLQLQLVLVAVLLVLVLVLILVQFLLMVVVLEAILKVVVVMAPVVEAEVTVMDTRVKAFTQGQVISVLLDRALTVESPVWVMMNQAPLAAAAVVVAPAAMDQVMVLVDRVAVAQLSLLDYLQ
jgi:hypothetical protein